MNYLLPMGHTTQVISEENVRDIQRAVTANQPLSDSQRLVVDAMASHFTKHAGTWIDEETQPVL